jgi:hypothetical protein
VAFSCTHFFNAVQVRPKGKVVEKFSFFETKTPSPLFLSLSDSEESDTTTPVEPSDTKNAKCYSSPSRAVRYIRITREEASSQLSVCEITAYSRLSGKWDHRQSNNGSFPFWANFWMKKIHQHSLKLHNSTKLSPNSKVCLRGKGLLTACKTARTRFTST